MNLQAYYSDYREEDRLVRDNAHRLEFDTTIKMLKRYIIGTKSILDIGAGTGRYSYYYSGLGCSVTAFEYTTANIEWLNKKNELAQYDERIQVLQGDARDLSCFEEDTFEVVLCMGPIYHLGSRDEKIKCINECKRVVKPDGLIIVAYLNKFAQYAYSVNQEDMQYEHVDALISGNKAILEEQLFKFDSPEEIENIMLECDIVKETHFAADGISYLLRNTINKFNEVDYQKYLSNHLKMCEEMSILGYSMHGLFVGKKRG